MDTDLDCDEAIELAPQYLPPTPAKFGRAGKPRSHWLYQVIGETPAKKFKHNGEVIVELRGDHSSGYGGQTAFPPSIHPSGEHYEWEPGAGPPAVVTYEELSAAVERLVEAVRIARGGPAPKDAGPSKPSPTIDLRSAQRHATSTTRSRVTLKPSHASVHSLRSLPMKH